MESEIGEVAGRIWRYLNGKGVDSLNKVKTSIGLNDRMFYMGIGWLAREKKVKFSQGKKGELKISLNKGD